MSIKSYTLFAILVLVTLLARGQEIVLRGHVMDGQSIHSLRDVNVYTTTQKGTYTDIDGNFTLKAFVGDTLHFKLLGYQLETITISDSLALEPLMISLKKTSIMLENVQIREDYQANTIIRNPNRNPMQVNGVYAAPQTEADDYHLGVMGSLTSPATAIYRMASKTYKQEKRVYEEKVERREEDRQFEIASEKMEELLEILDERLDEYYYLDFIHYLGMDLGSFARRDVYELVQLMPDSLDHYFDQLDAKLLQLQEEQKKP